VPEAKSFQSLQIVN